MEALLPPVPAEPVGVDPPAAEEDEADAALDGAVPEPDPWVEPAAGGEYVPSSVPLDFDACVDGEGDDEGVDDPDEGAVEEDDVDDEGVEDFGINTGEETGATVSDMFVSWDTAQDLRPLAHQGRSGTVRMRVNRLRDSLTFEVAQCAGKRTCAPA